MKYYAVRQGRKPGIYETWEEAREQVHNYSEAVYKSFEELEEALDYMQGTPPDLIPEGLPVAYIDGSFSPKKGIYSYGGYIQDGGKVAIIQGTGHNPKYTRFRNIAGELLGALQVSMKAQEMDLAEIVLYIDYAGIQCFAEGTWKPKTDLSRHYAQIADIMADSVKVHYRKVRGHTGIEGNELADYLAKEAAGVAISKKAQETLERFRQRALFSTGISKAQ